MAKAVIDTDGLALENLRLENGRLKAHIAELSEKLDAYDDGKNAKADHQAAERKKTKVPSDTDAWNRYVSTCKALAAVLEKFAGILEVDVANARIVDLSESPPMPLVSGAKGKAFFEWYRKNR